MLIVQIDGQQQFLLLSAWLLFVFFIALSRNVLWGLLLLSDATRLLLRLIRLRPGTRWNSSLGLALFDAAD